MKKKFTLMLAGVIALTSFAAGAVGKGLVEKIEAELRGDFTVVIDGKVQTFRDVNGKKVDPVLYDGTTYLPVRAIGEMMGKTVYWYQDEKRIELVEPSGEDTLVTDADGIVDGSGKQEKDKVKEEKPKKEENTTPQGKITLEEAKEIVLKKALLKENDVVFTKAKLENDDGRLLYDIDFKTDTAKYDAEVDAENGEVTEWEVEEKRQAEVNKPEAEITLEKAKAIALEKAGLKEKDVVFEEAKLDYDDGRLVYEIEFIHGRVEYSATISAEDGKILEWEKDND